MQEENTPETIETPQEETKQESKKRRVGREIREWGVALVCAVLVYLLLTQVILVNARIPSESMENTIMVGDRVLGFRLSYVFSEPERGDIIIFRFPDNEKDLYVKRVIGLPGDRVQIEDGKVYLNDDDEPLDEPYIADAPRGNYGPYIVPEGHYFVMGDNRNHSSDSRMWNNTFVAEEKILGKASFRLWPSPGFLEND